MISNSSIPAGPHHGLRYSISNLAPFVPSTHLSQAMPTMLAAPAQPVMQALPMVTMSPRPVSIPLAQNAVQPNSVNTVSQSYHKIYNLSEHIFSNFDQWRIGRQKWDESIIFISPDKIIDNSVIIQYTDMDKCEICLENATSEKPLIKMNECSGTHYFHKSCIKDWLNIKMECPYCKIPFPGVVPGPQPNNGIMAISINTTITIPGESTSGAIAIVFSFDNGIQDNRHSSPSQPYTGTSRSVYLPNSIEGQNALKRIKYAWDIRILFNVGTSLTTGKTNCVIWNGIPFKTRLDGGPALHGYPDPGYLAELNSALDAQNIP
jgi:deltex-like protein